MHNTVPLAIFSILIGAVAYALYIWRTVKGQIRPHPFSWGLWAFVTGIAAAAQLTKGAGRGSWVTIFTAAVCFLIALISAWHGDRAFPPLDWVVLMIGVVALVFLWYAKQPTYAAWCATIADVVGKTQLIRFIGYLSARSRVRSC